MNFNIKRSDLLPCLQCVSGNIDRRQTLPILSNLLFDIKPNSFSVTTTDMEVELVVEVEVKLEESTRITLPARKLLDICRSLPDDSELEFNIKDQLDSVKQNKKSR